MKQEKQLKKVLILFFLCAVSFPLVVYFLPLKISAKVHRVDYHNRTEELSFSTWSNASFQFSFEKYLNDHLGLYPSFVRLRNQLDYSLFKIAHTGQVVNGVNNYLFEKVYIDAHFGLDFVGDHVIDSTTNALKVLQDTLAARGKLALFCLATGKCSYYPEYIPYTEEQHKTNKQGYLEAFNKKGINYIDCAPWFLSMRDSMKHHLFPKYGIHWSYYSTVLVTDSIVNYINDRTQWNLPELSIIKKEISNTPRYYDDDVAQSMNLLVDVESPPMVYPVHEWSKTAHEKKSLLIIGDSFTWDILDRSRIGTECFDSIQFFYYNQSVHPPHKVAGIQKLTRHLDLQKVIDHFDAFLFISNEPNLINGGWGFADNAIQLFKDSSFVPEERNNKLLRNKCNNSPTWRADLESRAKKRNITLDSMVNIYLHDRTFKPY